MIFHIPQTTTLLSTDVVDTEPLYDPNATYSDGDLVKKSDGIYSVYNKSEDVQYPDYQDYLFYFQDNPVVINGLGYKKKYDNVGRGCWEDAFAAFTYPVTMNRFEYYDGSDFFSITIDANTSNTPCPNDRNYQFHATTIDAIGTKDVTVTVTRVSDNTILNQYNFTLHPKPIVSNGFIFVMDNGKVAMVKGEKSTTIVGTQLDDGIWEQLPHTYYTNTYHELYYYKPLAADLPFDDKQYSAVTTSTPQTWKLNPPDRTVYDVSSILLGNVVGDNVQIRFMSNGSVIHSEVISLYANTIQYDAAFIISNKTPEPSTIIYYIPQTVISNQWDEAWIDIAPTLTAPKAQIGFIRFGNWIDVGATNLEFSNDIKNFDKNKVSEVSGYIDHIKGQRVVQHKGSFDIQLTDYDKVLRINKRFAQELIAIDGSDNKSNIDTDSNTVFQATQLIGRLKRMSMQTRTKQNKLDDTQTISFEFEEVV